MKILYLDCFSGISGDMAVGALIDAGVPLDALRDGLALLGLDPTLVRLETRTIMRSQIRATKFDVVVVGEEAVHDRPQPHAHPGAHDHAHGHADEHGRAGDLRHERGHSHAHVEEHDHPHEHSHSHSQDRAHDRGGTHRHDVPHDHRAAHGHPHSDDHAHDHADGHAHDHDHRSYATIAAMIDRSALPARVRQRSLAIFREIAIAEARIHDTDVEHVHFHEVGALDSIADIVAFAVGLEHLGIDAVYSSPIPLGSGGFIRTQHGTMPLPAPATLEILKTYPVRLTDVPFELTTPTGAGMIRALSRGLIAQTTLAVERVGFGAGTRELPDRPNLLRAVVAERAPAASHDTVTEIACNLDDLNPQIYPHLFELLLAAGASDVHLADVLMKKGRPGHVLTVLAPPERVEALTAIVFAETTTIGVRYSEHDRRILSREAVVLETEFGPVAMKRVELGATTRTVPELEEGRRIAAERGLPLQQVLRRLQEIAAAGDDGGR